MPVIQQCEHPRCSALTVGPLCLAHDRLPDVGRMPKHPFNVELHTDEKGEAVVQGFDTGVVLVQVIAHGYQTYGQEFIMKDANETVHVKLVPPKSQVTIYH